MRLAVWLVAAASSFSLSPAAEFLAGADCSHLRFFETRGVTYKEAGQQRDALEILAKSGLNCVRLRLFTSSAAEADPYNRINNLEYTLPLAIRVKRAGLRLMLDFHYSDTWADPGKQAKPAAWKDLSFPDLEQRMYDYNRACLETFRTNGVAPDYVQVGNEITSGLLWPDGRVGGAYENHQQWSRLGRLLKAALRGIRDGAGPQQPKTIIHIDRGADWAATRWYFDNLRQQQVDFDIIGQSYYPFWHGTLTSLRTCLQNAADRYAKPIAIVETAFPWRNSTNIVDIPATPEGQVGFIVELTKILKALPNERGAGIVWWGTEYHQVDGVRTAGFEHRSLFDANGDVLPAAGALGQSAAPVALKATPTGAGLKVSWPLSGIEFGLVTATNLAWPIAWATTPTPGQNDGPTFGVIFPIGNERSRFFRLQSD